MVIGLIRKQQRSVAKRIGLHADEGFKLLGEKLHGE